MRRVATVALCVVSSLAALPGAHAQSAPAQVTPSPGAGVTQADAPPRADVDAELAVLREGTLYARYREVVTRARSLLARTDLDARQRNAALELLATAQVATRDDAGARETLATLFSRDPEHRLTDADASPPVQSAFARAREAAHERLAVGLDNATQPPSHDSVVLSVRVSSGLDAVEELRVSYRLAGSTRFERGLMSVTGDVAQAALPPLPTRAAARVEWFVEALAPSRALLAAYGSATAPNTLDVPAATLPPVALTPDAHDATAHPGQETREPRTPPAEEGGLLTKWYFWTIVGVVAVGAAAGTYVAVERPFDPPSGNLGTVQLR